MRRGRPADREAKMTTTIGHMTKGVELDLFAATDANVLDGMIRAQGALGQITWTKISETVAFGQFTEIVSAHNDATERVETREETRRVVVLDVDNADVKTAVEAAFWVNV
ncbi:hypothetical protein 40BC_094 [Mycobacterium phage 40BC]|nr:hypothetical protein 40BC_094 [Mycobacterium phage 40BC]